MPAEYFCGIDIGSTTIKVFLLDGSGEAVAHRIAPTGGQFYERSAAVLASLLEAQGIAPEAIRYTVATGYGRKLFKQADESVSEITANATGAMRLSNGAGPPKTIINIGGQDSKVILLDANGRVRNFAMNDRCAAGTGRFLEMAARIMDVDIEELGEQHMRMQGIPITISSTCTVFAESEIISLLARGHRPEEVIAGIHYAIARRIARLARRAGMLPPVLFDGGPALNRGLVAALEDELMEELLLPQTPQTTTALGAALLAWEAVKR